MGGLTSKEGQTFRYMGEWKPDSNYKRGDLVCHDGRFYKCTKTHNGYLVFGFYFEKIVLPAGVTPSYAATEAPLRKKSPSEAAGQLAVDRWREKATKVNKASLQATVEEVCKVVERQVEKGRRSFSVTYKRDPTLKTVSERASHSNAHLWSFETMIGHFDEFQKAFLDKTGAVVTEGTIDENSIKIMVDIDAQGGPPAYEKEKSI